MDYEYSKEEKSMIERILKRGIDKAKEI